MKRKIIFSIVGFLTLLFFALVYLKFFISVTNFKKEEVYVQIPTGSNYTNVEKLLSPYIKSKTNFEYIAKIRSYKQNVKPGRFLIKKGMNAYQIITALRLNIPVKLSFNNQERLENLCERLSTQIEPNKTELYNALFDSVFIVKNGFTKDNVLAMFLPNTYEVYWNISPEKFRIKMLKEYQLFWTKERLLKARSLNLTPIQIITLASIVHKESVRKSERPTIAGVYLNRLKKGILLQADPTVIYAIKLSENNFNKVIKRVLNKDLVLQSPYNTYQNQGLPPGPIAMPDIDAIDAVLNAKTHNYIYFCASVEKFGYHVFAVTLSEHLQNAKKYTNWLNQQGTKR